MRITTIFCGSSRRSQAAHPDSIARDYEIREPPPFFGSGSFASEFSDKSCDILQNENNVIGIGSAGFVGVSIGNPRA